MISYDWFYISILGKGWILLERLKRIIENANKGLIVDFYYKEGKMKVKEEG